MWKKMGRWVGDQSGNKQSVWRRSECLDIRQEGMFFLCFQKRSENKYDNILGAFKI